VSVRYARRRERLKREGCACAVYRDDAARVLLRARGARPGNIGRITRTRDREAPDLHCVRVRRVPRASSGRAGSAAADVLHGTDATEQARDMKAKRCGDRRGAHGVLSGRHVSTRAHGCMHATRTRSSMHSIRPAAQPSRSRCSGTPDTDMQCERLSERRAIVDARRERWELYLRVSTYIRRWSGSGCA
jgi:hypothetical protein